MTGTPEGSTESGFMEKPGIEPATPGLQGIALIHYTTGAYYKPKEDDQNSLDMLRCSLERLIGKKGNILVLGDFNLPKFSWVDCEPSIKPDCTCRTVYYNFEDILNDFNLVQLVTKVSKVKPTRQDNILDLVLASNPTLIPKITCIPGLSDRDIVCIEAAVKPTQTKQKRRKIHLYNKADWTDFRSKLKDYQTEFLNDNHGKSVGTVVV